MGARGGEGGKKEGRREAGSDREMQSIPFEHVEVQLTLLQIKTDTKQKQKEVGFLNTTSILTMFELRM